MIVIGFKLRDFIVEKYPNRKVVGYVSPRVAAEERYVQVSTFLDDMDIHYELYQNHVELHLEGKCHNAENQEFLNQLHQQSAGIPSLSWLPRQGKEQFRCQIDMPVNSWEEVKAAFDAIIAVFDPIIETVIKQKSMQEKNTSSKSDEQNKNIDAAIVSVGKVLSIGNLRIPEYQRPYRWSEKNVRQLLEDILESKNAGKKSYRIGSVILFNNEERKTLDIVDGQQRLTTLFILAKACDKNITQNSLRYNHVDSVTNIKNNYSFIQLWLDENCKESRGDYLKYIKESCEFVKIIVYDLSEAFQMFDSQNGRGKELEAFNKL